MSERARRRRRKRSISAVAAFDSVTLPGGVGGLLLCRLNRREHPTRTGAALWARMSSGVRNSTCSHIGSPVPPPPRNGAAPARASLLATSACLSSPRSRSNTSRGPLDQGAIRSAVAGSRTAPVIEVPVQMPSTATTPVGMSSPVVDGSTATSPPVTRYGHRWGSQGEATQSTILPDAAGSTWPSTRTRVPERTIKCSTVRPSTTKLNSPDEAAPATRRGWQTSASRCFAWTAQRP